MQPLNNSLLQEEVRILKIQLAEARETILQLRKELIADTWTPPLELGLTPQESVVLAALFTHAGVCTKERLYAATTSINPDRVPEIKIIDVWICKIRKKIKDYDLVITTHHGRGYSLTRETRLLLHNWNTG